MNEISWFKNGRGFSWVVAVTSSGIFKASLKLVTTRRGPRIVRTLYLIPKRGREDGAREVFTEFYDPVFFKRILDAAETLASPLLTGSDPLRRAVSEIARVSETLNLILKNLEEVIRNEGVKS